MSEEWDGRERRKAYPKDCFVDVHSKLEDINLSIAALSQAMHSHVDQYKLDYKRHQDSLEKHEETIYGNGKDGIVVHLAKQTEIFKAFSENLIEHFRDDAQNFKVIFRHLYMGLGGITVLAFLLKFAFR